VHRTGRFTLQTVSQSLTLELEINDQVGGILEPSSVSCRH
jgi:hypothetical protein